MYGRVVGNGAWIIVTSDPPGLLVLSRIDIPQSFLMLPLSTLTICYFDRVKGEGAVNECHMQDFLLLYVIGEVRVDAKLLF